MTPHSAVADTCTCTHCRCERIKDNWMTWAWWCRWLAGKYTINLVPSKGVRS